MKAIAKLAWFIALSGIAGCNTQGSTREANVERIAQALQGYDTGVYAADIEDPAFTAAMGSGSDWGAALSAFVNNTAVQRLRLACNKTYTVQSTVDICRQIIIEGCGPTTVISAAAGVTPFKVKSAAACAGSGASGAESRFHDFTLSEAAAASVVRYGIWAEAAIHVEDVDVKGFSNGIRIDADATRSGSARSDANSWSINRVTVESAEHAGMIAVGRDANAGLAEVLIAKNNCTQASKLDGAGNSLYPVHSGAGPIFTDCAGVVDATLGGNVWAGMWTTGTGGGFPGSRFEGFDANGDGQIDAADDSGHSVCLGCRKDEAPASILSKNGVAVGNRSAYSGGGIALVAGRTMTSATLTTPGLWPTNTATDSTPPVMYLKLRDGSVMNMERNGDYNLRGSWKGANAYTGWYWNGSPASWYGVP